MTDSVSDSPNRNPSPETFLPPAAQPTTVPEPLDPTRLSISTKTPTVALVIKRMVRDEIVLNPNFQRNADIWDSTRQSRLIESLLLRIPLPAFYMAADRDNRWQVVDGFQRLCSIESFVLNKTFELRGLEYLTQFERCTYDDLPRDMRRRIDETTLTFHVINAGTPPEVMLNVFKRVQHSLTRQTPAPAAGAQSSAGDGA